MAEAGVEEITGFALAMVLGGDGGEGVGGAAWLPLGPGRALAFAPSGSAGLAALAGPEAIVVDQSSAWRLFALSGAGGWRVLQAGIPVDLSPAAFAPGAVVASLIGHIGIIAHHAAPGRYHLFVARSLADSLRHWLEATAASLPDA
ncbi:MAG TPA: sarcosine oxidase subunit gamma family protein [Novosphingobium sp.]|nr:sarcosine oxidase subunit gamma family protein [Novosphingobium sp.]